MDEADFAAKILGTTPEELEFDENSEPLTNEEEVSDEQVQNPKEESRTLEDNEDTDTQQEEESETTENPQLDSRSKRRARADRYARMLAERNNNAQSENSVEGIDLSEGGEFTWEQIQQKIKEEARQEALETYRKEELKRYEEEIKEDWVDEVRELTEKYPELNPNSKAYNKDIDDLLTQMVTNPDGTIRFDVSVSETYNKILALQERAATIRSHQNKAKIAGQIDESAISGQVDPSSSKSELNIDDMDYLDIFDAAKAGKL